MKGEGENEGCDSWIDKQSDTQSVRQSVGMTDRQTYIPCTQNERHGGRGAILCLVGSGFDTSSCTTQNRNNKVCVVKDMVAKGLLEREKHT